MMFEFNFTSTLLTSSENANWLIPEYLTQRGHIYLVIKNYSLDINCTVIKLDESLECFLNKRCWTRNLKDEARDAIVCFLTNQIFLLQ